MEGSLLDNRFASFVDDRPQDRVFRVDRSIYTDPAVFEAEIARIYENGWVFLCHESQVKETGSYFSTEIGRQPVFVIRQKDGSVRGFINACAHRGALLTPFKQGKATVLTCRFHGWSYGCDGHCIKIKNEEMAFGQEFARAQFDLTPVPRVESYRGFVFGSLNPDVPPIADYLGAAAKWIDMLVVQSPEGLEVVPGSSTYTIYGNWKMQVENAVDGYHVSTVHRVFAATVRNREERDGITGGLGKTEGGRIAGQVPSGSYDLGNGHMSIWATHTTPEVRPVYQQKERLERELSAEEVRWILTRGRNLAVFPNVMIMDNPSTQIRVVKPIAPDRAEVSVYCIAPVGEPRAARAARLRKFEDFYLTFGMATSDDMAALEDSYEGSKGRLARWNDISNGMATMIDGPDEDAKRLGFRPVSSNVDWMAETLFYGFYRRWRQMMTTPGRNE